MMFLLSGLVPLMRASDKKINTYFSGQKDYDKVTMGCWRNTEWASIHFWDKESDMENSGEEMIVTNVEELGEN